MSTMTLSAKGGGDFFRLRFWAAALLVLGMFLMLGVGQANAAPLVGTSIGNQASATYTDANSISRVTVSNTVATIVQQVGGGSLSQTQTKVGAPGQPISFPHTITNTGNGPDTYTIGTQTLTGTSISALPSLFIDANCDGVADNSTAITQIGPIAPGAQACFVAQATLAAAAGGTTGSFQVTAVSGVAGAPAVSNSPNTDTATINTAGVISVTKSISRSSGASGTTVTYTLTYRNTGTQTAFGVVLADQVANPNVTIGNTLAALNPVWSGGTITALGTVIGSTPNRINVVVSATGANKVVAVIESVPPNSQGTFSFDALETGGPINYNTAQFCYRDATTAGATQPSTVAGVVTACDNIIGTTVAGTGSGVLSGTASASYNSAAGIVDTNVGAVVGSTNINTTNTVPFYVTVAAASGSMIVNNGNTTGGGGNGTAVAGNPNDGNNPTVVNTGTTNDLNTVASAPQGSVVSFSNWVWNTGTATDAFNVTALTTANNFPAGTSFLLMRADGNTPLTDSDGDGVVDTGPIGGTNAGSCSPTSTGSPNATATGTTPCGYRVVVRAILPPNVSGNNGGIGWDVVIQARSSLSPAVVNSVADHLTTIAGSTVDLLNPFSSRGNYTFAGNTWSQGCAFTDVSNTGGTCSTYVTGGGAGQQASGEAAPVTIISGNPGTQVRYKLDVTNTGAVPDSFDLAYNVGSGVWTVVGLPAFSTPGALPGGFQLRFYAATNTDCSGTFTGQQISNTGVIQPVSAAPNNVKLICAVVDIPVGAASQTLDLFFRAVSPTTVTATTGSSADVKHDRLFINTFRLVSITPNNSGQVFPGGSIAYCHTVSNLGNIAETNLGVGPASNNTPPAPWPANATYYLDSDKNCQLSAAEALAPLSAATTIASLPAAIAATPGNNTANYIIVVQAPPAATPGQTIVTTLPVTPSAIVNTTTPAVQTATDTTTVVIGQVTLVKSQVVDPIGNGLFSGTGCVTPMSAGAGNAGGLTYVQTQLAAKPDACIIYKVVATNIGTQPVSLVQIFDTTPPNTYCAGVAFAVGGPVVTTTGVCNGTAAANFSTSAITLNPNQAIELYFRVRIAP